MFGVAPNGLSFEKKEHCATVSKKNTAPYTITRRKNIRLSPLFAIFFVVMSFTVRVSDIAADYHNVGKFFY